MYGTLAFFLISFLFSESFLIAFKTFRITLFVTVFRTKTAFFKTDIDFAFYFIGMQMSSSM